MKESRCLQFPEGDRQRRKLGFLSVLAEDGFKGIIEGITGGSPGVGKAVCSVNVPFSPTARGSTILSHGNASQQAPDTSGVSCLKCEGCLPISCLVSKAAGRLQPAASATPGPGRAGREVGQVLLCSVSQGC